MRKSLEPAETRKLIGILGRLASDQLGERAAAGLLASRMLRNHGLTWSDVIGGVQRLELPPELARAAEEARAARAAQRGIGQELAFCARHVTQLKVWERQFIENVAMRSRTSPKQAAIVCEIAKGLRGRGLT